MATSSSVLAWRIPGTGEPGGLPSMGSHSRTRLKRLSSSSSSSPMFESSASLVAQRLKRLPSMRETWVQFLGWEDALEKEMATHSSILAWRIPWTEEPGGLQSTGSQRVGHDWAQTWCLNLTYSNYCFSMYILLMPNSQLSFIPFFFLKKDKWLHF